MLYDAVLPALPVKMYYCTIAYLNIIAKFVINKRGACDKSHV